VGWQLDDPGSTHAIRGNGQSARGFHDRRELQLHTSQGKAQHPFAGMSVVRMIIFFLLVLSDLPAPGVNRCDHERARKIGAQDGQQEEFSLRIHFREFR
jgi:hypothetical protein